MDKILDIAFNGVKNCFSLGGVFNLPIEEVTKSIIFLNAQDVNDDGCNYE